LSRYRQPRRDGVGRDAAVDEIVHDVERHRIAYAALGQPEALEFPHLHAVAERVRAGDDLGVRRPGAQGLACPAKIVSPSADHGDDDLAVRSLAGPFQRLVDQRLRGDARLARVLDDGVDRVARLLVETSR
jgi:hypothetical protein